MEKTLIKQYSAYEQMKPRLSAKALNLMDTKSPTQFVRNGLDLITQDNQLELLTLAIATTETELEKAMDYMAAELNCVAELGLWNSTLGTTKVIELGIEGVGMRHIALSTFIVVPAKEADLVREIIESVQGRDHLLHSLGNPAPDTQNEPL